MLILSDMNQFQENLNILLDIYAYRQRLSANETFSTTI